jgi:predicted ABC-type ATPase
MLRQSGSEYFNPDEASSRLQTVNPGLSREAANGAAWREGKRLLERAIAERLDFAFETTLGGNSITDLLQQAMSQGIEVRMWFAGLSNSDLHLARVRARVAKGGHDIPEADIRRRFDSGRQHLVELLPKLTELRVYDNSFEADPHTGQAPQPALVLHLEQGTIRNLQDLARTPEWAKPIVAAAMKLVTR